MLKFHSDMAKHKSQGNKSCLQYYTVLDSLQVFKIGFLFEIQVHSSWFSIVIFEGQTFSVKNSLSFQ